MPSPASRPHHSRRKLLIAVHDVTPARAGRLAGIFTHLDGCGVNRYAILVVPNWHGDWLLDEHPQFVADLRARQRAGAEVFLHGWCHDERGSRRSAWHRLRAWGRTAGEAEFLSLSPTEAARRIDRGLTKLRECGLDPVGFVPPAWFHGRRSFDLLRERGLDITEDAWTIVSLTERRRLRAPAVQWSTRTRWRARAGVAIAAVRLPLDSRRRLLRLVIHPTDLDVPAVERSVWKTLHALLQDREPLAYREALAVT